VRDETAVLIVATRRVSTTVKGKDAELELPK
jgi:hypothetical protein